MNPDYRITYLCISTRHFPLHLNSLGRLGRNMLHIYIYTYLNRNTNTYTYMHNCIFISVDPTLVASSPIYHLLWAARLLPFPSQESGSAAALPILRGATTPGDRGQQQEQGLTHWAGHPWFHMGFPWISHINHGIFAAIFHGDFPWLWKQFQFSTWRCPIGAPNPNPKQVMDDHDDLYSFT